MREHEAAQKYHTILLLHPYSHSQQSDGGSEGLWIAGDRLAFVPVLTVAARSGEKEKQLCAHSVHLCAVNGINYLVK